MTVDELVARGAVRKNKPVKVLGSGDISVAVRRWTQHVGHSEEQDRGPPADR